MKLEPLPGFDWSRVKWGGANQRRTATCSYCSEPLDEDQMPLILWKESGDAAEFCERCQRRWWGMETFPDDEDEC